MSALQPLSADDGRDSGDWGEGKVQAIQWSAHVIDVCFFE